jgi:hypothetical protein
MAELTLRSDLEGAIDLGSLLEADTLRVGVSQGRANVWLSLRLGDREVAHLRLGPNAGDVGNVQTWSRPDATGGCEFTTPVGPVRVRVSLYAGGAMRCTTSLLPVHDTRITDWPRDFLAASEAGTIHTSQRGLRSGIVFASGPKPFPFSVMYVQNFSTLDGYFTATKCTPAGTVGGTWPLLGYAPPTGDDCILPKAREVVVSDAYVALRAEELTNEDAIAASYLDRLAVIYTLLDKPAPRYHHWASRAESTLRALSLSPLCTYVRQGRRYLVPYVDDEAKPPESMVQFTVAVNAGEYDRWRNQQSVLAATLRATAATFFDEAQGCIVRWLPGESFGEQQAEENMSHEAMDSWYLHHALFNVFRIAREGDDAAKEIFRKSLPYLVRVAHRFDYHWPVFFNLQTLDNIRAEAKPGAGGETDVAGLYALVMIHAHEMFGDGAYLDEAVIAVSHLEGLGFDLAYQLNTTGFAAEAALRLWKKTGERRYLALSEICMANIFDNMWLWQCTYGNARHYPTFFGMFPLRAAPYIAPYEELEAHAKFHEFLELGGDDLRPSLKLLLAEFQKYALDRCWYYYPDALPVDAVAAKPRNGRIERDLAVPLEDLQDGREASGQVGQEVYGAGLAFVMTSRHYMHLDGTGMTAFCDYPMYDFASTRQGGSWRAGGDPAGTCVLRVIPTGPDTEARMVSASVRAGSVAVPLDATLSPEGHALFTLRGGQTVDIQCAQASRPADGAVIVGAMAAGRP